MLILQSLHATSRVGFAVNFLQPPKADELSPKELYRPSAERWIGYCEKVLRSSVELVTDYGMREYTLLVRRCETTLNSEKMSTHVRTEKPTKNRG